MMVFCVSGKARPVGNDHQRLQKWKCYRRDSASIPSLSLTDIYAIITYYLWSREEVETYLEERRRVEEVVRRENEIWFPPAGVRERILARRPPQV